MSAKTRKKKGPSAREAARTARKERAKGKVGRPSLFTPERVERLLTGLSQVGFKDAAARMAGINPRTLYDWLDLGKKELEDGADGERAIVNLEEVEATANSDEPIAPIYEPCVTFAQLVHAVGLVQATTEARASVAIQEAFSHSWQAAAWYLERAFPERWGRATKQVVEHTGKADGAPVKVDATHEHKIPAGVIIMPALADEE